MNILRKIGVLVLAIGVAGSFAQAAEKEKGNGKADATLRLSGKGIAAGIGVSWGKGTLSYKGKDYPVSVNGLALAKVGLTRTTASGEVYNLNRLRDFNGNYTAASRGGRGVTLGSGGSGVLLENQSGVRIRMRSTTQGADLTVGRGGIELKIQK